MPRYFFDTDDGDTLDHDDEGQELPGTEEARQAALDALPDMARDKMPDGDHRTFLVTVRHDLGLVMYSATMSLKGEWRAPRWTEG